MLVRRPLAAMSSPKVSASGQPGTFAFLSAEAVAARCGLRRQSDTWTGCHPTSRSYADGSATSCVRSTVGHFSGNRDLVAATASDSTFLSDLTETFARVFLANVEETGKVIGFIHAVTGPSAVRLIAPHVSEAASTALRRYAWQAAAALYAAMGRREPSDEECVLPAATADELADAAAATLDPHAIKFTEACLREYALNPKPVYLVAAADATERIRQAE